MAEVIVQCAERFARLEERVEDCEEYQNKNNGAIVRMSEDVKDIREDNQKSKDLLFKMILGLYALIISGMWALHIKG